MDNGPRVAGSRCEDDVPDEDVGQKGELNAQPLAHACAGVRFARYREDLGGEEEDLGGEEEDFGGEEEDLGGEEVHIEESDAKMIHDVNATKDEKAAQPKKRSRPKNYRSQSCEFTETDEDKSKRETREEWEAQEEKRLAADREVMEQAEKLRKAMEEKKRKQKNLSENRLRGSRLFGGDDDDEDEKKKDEDAAEHGHEFLLEKGTEGEMSRKYLDSRREMRQLDARGGLFTVLWEPQQGRMRASHEFNMGLELDKEPDPNVQNLPDPMSPKTPYKHLGVNCQDTKRALRVHLPCLSLNAFSQLRAALGPTSLAVDVGPISLADKMRPAEGDQNQSGGERPFRMLLDFLERSGLSLECRREVEALLGPRLSLKPKIVAKEAMDPQKMPSTVLLVEPQAGAMQESVDMSIVPLKSFPSDWTPLVAVARLHEPTCLPGELYDKRSAAAKFVVLLVCSEVEESIESARQLGRALATAFMDEQFESVVRVVPDVASQIVVDAYDTHLSKLTILPAVYLKGDDANAGKSADETLEDIFVENMKRRIRKSRGLPDLARHKAVDGHPAHRHCAFLVEVDEMGLDGNWRGTHRLHHGVEVDAGDGHMSNPHLPKLSISSLSGARELLSTESIALDVTPTSTPDLIDQIMNQLNTAGLNGYAQDHFRACLNSWVDSKGESPSDILEPLGKKDQKAPEWSEVMQPSKGEERICVLVIPCRNTMVQKPVAAFLRFAEPPKLGGAPKGGERPEVRIVFVLGGPARMMSHLQSLGDALGALAVDENLMGEFAAATQKQRLLDCIDGHLSKLLVVPQHHLGALPWALTDGDHEQGHGGSNKGAVRCIKVAISIMQKYSLPLVTGVIVALIWAQIDFHGYHEVIDYGFFGLKVGTYNLSLHFLVNDIFMCFFFGLAMKEVTEAVLPGGCLSPPKKAVNPLMATAGGVVGPVAVYILFVLLFWEAGSFDGQQCEVEIARRLGGGGGGGSGVYEQCTLATIINGWGIPTATDISLAWMIAQMIFGDGHPAINYLLLLAVVDDAIGMLIIALAYPDPVHPLEPLYLTLIVVCIIVCVSLRMFVPAKWQKWQFYIFFGMPFSWAGLFCAHMHPALALVPVVPFMPAKLDMHSAISKWRRPSLWKSHAKAAAEIAAEKDIDVDVALAAAKIAAETAAHCHDHDAPLHKFEHALKLLVDIGMFFFGLCNAGVEVKELGGTTMTILLSLVVGKTIGIAGFGAFAVLIGFPLPRGLTLVDLTAAGALGGVGLTVALFVAGEAFTDAGLQGHAKLGALLSVGSAIVAYYIKTIGEWVKRKMGWMAPAKKKKSKKGDHLDSGDISGFQVDEILVSEILDQMWTRRRMAARWERLS
jgi:NhaA family Na+:H+ antiporter